jgi:hypothetical protein
MKKLRATPAERPPHHSPSFHGFINLIRICDRAIGPADGRHDPLKDHELLLPEPTHHLLLQPYGRGTILCSDARYISKNWSFGGQTSIRVSSSTILAKAACAINRTKWPESGCD